MKEKLIISNGAGLGEFRYLENEELQIRIYSIPLSEKEVDNSHIQDVFLKGAVVDCNNFSFAKGKIELIKNSNFSIASKEVKGVIYLEFLTGSLKIHFDKIHIKKEKIYISNGN